MSVIVVGPVPPPLHGAAMITAAAVQLMKDRGVPVRTFDTGVQHSGVRYHACRAATHVRAASRIAFGGRVNALYIGGAGGAGLWYQLAVSAAARLRGVPVVFHHHSSQYLNQRSTAMAVLCALGRRTTTHVTLSAAMSQALQARYPRAERLVQLSNVAFLALHERIDIGPKRQVAVIGHLSNLSRAKGLLEVLETFRCLQKREMDVELRLAGPVVDAADRLVIDAIVDEFPDRVRYLGALESSQVPGFLAELDLFLFPSRYRHEAEPLVVLEAAREGVPTLAYPVGGLPEILAATGGTLVPEGSAFADAVHRAVVDLRNARPGEVRSRVHDEMKRFRAGQVDALCSLLALLT